MAYRFKRDDASVEDGVRRIAIEQIERAVEEIEDDRLDAHEVVHQVRKRCKKLRGLIRLVRPAFDDFARENAALRDAANTLSFVRDTEALIETYDDLVETYAEQIDRRAFGPIRRRLTMRQREIAQSHDVGEKLAEFQGRMIEARHRVNGWHLDDEGFSAIAGGLAKTRKRARKAMALVRTERTTEAFHEWRKRVKYHWYHTRILTPIWPGPMKAHESAADRLGDMLGDHHDLAVFRATVTDRPETFGQAAEVEVLVGLIQRRQATLEIEAVTLGGKLLAEPTAALTRRWQDYWNIWRDETAGREMALAG